MDELIEEIANWMPPGQKELFQQWAAEVEARLVKLEERGAAERSAKIAASSMAQVLEERKQSYQEKVAGLPTGSLEAATKPPIIPLKPLGGLGGSGG